MGDRLPVDAALRAFVPTRRPYVMADRFTVDAAVAALLPPKKPSGLAAISYPKARTHLRHGTNCNVSVTTSMRSGR